MICPNKKCRIEIEDDSKFCDQCGSEILICSQCGKPGTGKFCDKDGGKMNSRKNNTPAVESIPLEESAVNPPEIPVQLPTPQREAPDRSMSTARPGDSLNSGVKEIIITHSSGLELKIRDNDMLGRNDGPHSEHLGNFNFISRSHAVICNRSGDWYIKDMGSTNKSKVNEIILEPEKEYPIKKDDRIMLADQEFIVK